MNSLSFLSAVIFISLTTPPEDPSLVEASDIALITNYLAS